MKTHSLKPGDPVEHLKTHQCGTVMQVGSHEVKVVFANSRHTAGETNYVTKTVPADLLRKLS
jgi:hypothetical protein